MVRLTEAIEAITQGIIEAISEGEEVKLRGLGTFKVKRKKETRCSNPQKPGEVLEIPAKSILRFEPSEELKAAARIAGEGFPEE